MIKNIFFDFDGVLCESVAVKTDAFRKLYLPFGEEIAQKVVDHHEANTGISRFKKIPYYHEHFLHQHLTDEQVKEWADKYAQIVIDQVHRAPEVRGATNFLKDHYQQYQLYIISATPEPEMQLIAGQRGWLAYFKEIHGAPETKNEWVPELLQKNGLKASETVFIGDAKADEEAAKNSGLHFILRRTEQNNQLFKDYKGTEIKDLIMLENVLSRI